VRRESKGKKEGKQKEIECGQEEKVRKHIEACLGKEKHETRKNAGNGQQSRKGADRMNGRFRPEKYEKEEAKAEPEEGAGRKKGKQRGRRGCGEEEKPNLENVGNCNRL
jgi:hypothetical protein